jgi:hypothetical protein
MAEIDTSRQISVETCNMLYCSKPNCDHLEYSQSRDNWNVTIVQRHIAGTHNKNMCTSSSLSSAIKKGTMGGHWRPTKCRSKQTIAIIIPFRNREEHLCILLKNLIPILIKHRLEFKIFVAEQVQKNFNSLITSYFSFLQNFTAEYDVKIIESIVF